MSCNDYSKYEKRFVFFIDVLGFSKKVEISTSPEEIKNIIDCLKQDFIRENKRHNLAYQITQVSDCIVISFEKSTRCKLLPMLLFINYMQTNALIKHGLLFRGAGTYGDLVHNDEYLFGTAYQEAYKLESKYAIYPRIIIKKSTLNELMSRNEKDACLTLLKEEDIFYYIDYLHNEIDSSDSVDKQKEFFITVRTLICKNLEAQPFFIDKYLWLKEKYNLAITNFNSKYHENLEEI